MTEPTSLVGRTIGRRYLIEELVGGGAMGDVYRAKHTGLGTDVAVKIMRPSIAAERKFKERFYREAKAASRLEHPNSVRVLDFGEEEDGLVYLAMEFLRGRDLLAILREEWPLTDERVVDILAQTLAALSLAHGNGIVHRDLKPENIMIVADEDDERRDCVKVCDFGIAKLTDARAFKSNEKVTTALTVGHAIIGTPEYMSPEQARGDPLDLRADLYSTGVVLYRMLTGQLPFEAENVIGLAVKHIMEEPTPPSHLRAGVNPRLEEICLRAMRKDPAQRFASAKEMRAELRAALSGDTRTSSPRASSTSEASVRLPNAVESAPTLRDGFAPIPKRARADSRPDAKSSTSDGDVVAVIDGSRRRVALIVLLAALGLAGVWLIIDSQLERSSKPGVGLVGTATGGPAIAPSNSTTLVALAEPPTASASTLTAPIRTGATVRGPATAPLPVNTAPPASVSRPAPPTPSPPASSTTAPPSSAPAPAGSYKPTNASVSLLPLVADRVQRDVVARKIAELMPRMNECYRDALFIVGQPIGGSAEIQMSVDPSGRIVSVVIAGQLPQFQRCASRLVQSLSVPSSAVEAGGGTASQSLKLTP